MRSPVIVVGPGRCGTSTVARLLVEIGVDMGGGFRVDPSNPDGSFEDEAIRDANDARLRGSIGPDRWRGMIEAATRSRSPTGKPWGWKDPRTSEFIDDVIRLYPSALFIRCERPRRDILASFLKWYSWDEQQAGDVIDRRTRLLDRYLPTDTDIVSVAELVADIDEVRERLRRIVFSEPAADDRDPLVLRYVGGSEVTAATLRKLHGLIGTVNDRSWRRYPTDTGCFIGFEFNGTRHGLTARFERSAAFIALIDPTTDRVSRVYHRTRDAVNMAEAFPESEWREDVP